MSPMKNTLNPNEKKESNSSNTTKKSISPPDLKKNLPSMKINPGRNGENPIIAPGKKNA